MDLPTLISRMSPFPIFGVLWVFFSPNLNRAFCKQTVMILFWFCTVCLCHPKTTLCLYRKNVWVHYSVWLFVKFLFNPYKPSVLFKGHRQTQQTQIRCPKTRRMISLHYLLTECSIKIWIKMKSTNQHPLKLKWTGPIDKIGKFHSA